MTTEGLLVYSLDEVTAFDPLDLDIHVTPARVFECLEKGEWMDALLMAMRLNEAAILRCAHRAPGRPPLAPFLPLHVLARTCAALYSRP